uniref:Large ribosomal subunit protein uL22 n=1 Tax=candidate division WOR-3 bacterium TaxID=2052148 RepID=A0A7C4XA85_UNCW3
MIFRAVKRYERLSPLKARRILRIIKGKDVPTARALLEFYHSRSKIPILKTLNSAVSNLKNRVGKVRIDDKDLYVKEAIAQDGPQMKRWRPGFRGTADMIRRRTCHIKIVIDSYKPIPIKKGE